MTGWYRRNQRGGRPELPSEAFERFSTYLGLEKAEEVAQDVRAGHLTVNEAEEWSISVQGVSERSHGRPDIEPKDWQAFEEGWRPDGW